MKRTYSTEEAAGIAQTLSIDFATSRFDLEQFRVALDVEAEHGQTDLATNVTNDDPVTTGKIASRISMRSPTTTHGCKGWSWMPRQTRPQHQTLPNHPLLQHDKRDLSS